MDDELENQDSLNPEGEQDTLTPEPEIVEESEELKKIKELAENYKTRAEKAEALAKQLKKPVEKETPKNDLSLKDIRALADVPDADVDDVIDWAKAKGLPIYEAKKTIAVQGILKAKAEERKTAEASSTGPSKRGASKVTDESLIENARAGKLPETDEDIRRLIVAKQKAKN